MKVWHPNLHSRSATACLCMSSARSLGDETSLGYTDDTTWIVNIEAFQLCSLMTRGEFERIENLLGGRVTLVTFLPGLLGCGRGSGCCISVAEPSQTSKSHTMC